MILFCFFILLNVNFDTTLPSVLLCDLDVLTIDK